MFGDILKVVDENYNIYAEYQYDIWGNCNIISNINNIANINPIRYRGYYYDNETNLYYLNSRYYDSFTHRFISIDSIEYMDFDTLGGLNLWIYCNNNPIMYVDPDGYFCILTAMLIGAVVWLIAGGAASALTQFATNHSVDWKLVLSSALFGAIDGALSVTGLGFVESAILSGALSGIQYIVEQAITGEEFSINDFFLSIAAAVIFSKIMPSNFDGHEMAGIYNTSKGYLKSLKSAKKIALYTSKIKMVRKTIIKKSILYALGSIATSAIQTGLNYTVNNFLGWN